MRRSFRGWRREQRNQKFQRASKFCMRNAARGRWGLGTCCRHRRRQHEELVTRGEGHGGQQRVCDTPNGGLGDSEGGVSAFPSGISFSVPLRHKSSAQTSSLSTAAGRKASGAGQLLGHCASLKPFALSLIHEAEPGPFTFPSIHSSNYFWHS